MLDNCEHLLRPVAAAGQSDRGRVSAGAGVGDEPRGAERSWRADHRGAVAGGARRHDRPRRGGRVRGGALVRGPGPGREGQLRGRRRQRRRRRARCVGVSTACRWRSSWRRRASPTMNPAELARRLDRRFRLLTGGDRDAIERHQTLRATIDWSYDLLSEPEQRLLDRLSVFAGGCTLDAAEAVCAGDPIEGDDVFELLANLVGPVAGRRRRHRARHPLPVVGDDPPIRRGTPRRDWRHRRGCGPVIATTTSSSPASCADTATDRNRSSGAPASPATTTTCSRRWRSRSPPETSSAPCGSSATCPTASCRSTTW